MSLNQKKKKKNVTGFRKNHINNLCGICILFFIFLVSFTFHANFLVTKQTYTLENFKTTNPMTTSS